MKSKGTHSKPKRLKRRARIPKGVKDKILVACRHCCCICHKHATQINHIDGDRSNWNFDNLIPLCPSCHGKVHTNYQMTQGYTTSQLKMYRDEWIQTCQILRVVAAAQNVAGDQTLEFRMTIKSLDRRVRGLEERRHR